MNLIEFRVQQQQVLLDLSQDKAIPPLDRSCHRTPELIRKLSWSSPTLKSQCASEGKALPCEGTRKRRAKSSAWATRLCRRAATLGFVPAIPDPEGKDAEDPQFLHTIDAGLTPLMYHAMRACPERVPPAMARSTPKCPISRPRSRFGNLCEAAVEVVDACQGVGVRPTLLKGISISHQHYPIPHLRPMGNLDILVPESELERVESSLLRTGLVRMPDQVRPAARIMEFPCVTCNGASGSRSTPPCFPRVPS